MQKEFNTSCDSKIKMRCSAVYSVGSHPAFEVQSARFDIELDPERTVMTATHKGAYGANDDLVDYILGITFEIWEERGIDLIQQYYGPDTVVYSLEGITHGSTAMIDGTNAVLEAFPDRLLLGDDVIGKGDSRSGYSSHRVLSPMTNMGDSTFGPATGKAVRIMNMADCVVEEGVITKEWLVRDNLALVRQLGFDVQESAALLKSKHTPELTAWFVEETERLSSLATAADNAVRGNAGSDPEQFSQQVLNALWMTGDATSIESAYAPYAVLHRSPIEIVSGRVAIAEHYAGLRGAFDCTAASVDHIAVQAAGEHALHVAARWSVCGIHAGEYLGVAATGKPFYIMGVSHRRIVDGRIAVEWTVFDSLALLSQLL
jgi:predicted ester cyclase